MKGSVHLGLNDVPRIHKHQHEDYEYYKRDLVPKGMANQCAIAVYEIPPGKSAYPYHYHVKNEEAFYIISGQGILKTPAGDKLVKTGDFLFFPANEQGAHKLINNSVAEPLVYLDFDTHNDLDATFYPDSGKVGVWGKDINKLYKVSESVDYYEGE